MNIGKYMLVSRMFARMIGRVPARHLWYLLRCMRDEKPHRFGRQVRINTFFPPYPSPAFDRFCQAVIARRRVPYSTYLALTGRCPCRCEHCSYAGRADRELSDAQLLDIVAQIKALGTCTLGLTGGEPLLRTCVEDLVRAAGPEMASILFTTGHGLDAQRARQLLNAGLACVTIGIECADAKAHDRVRGCPGSLEQAAAAAQACRQAGLYLALSTLATRQKLAFGELERIYTLAEQWQAGELRVLSPVATGGWHARREEMLTESERRQVIAFHRSHNRRAGGPAVAAFAHLESDALFGCGAGFHHLFVDASGQVCPCDLTPLSFGDATQEPLIEIWRRMGAAFPAPRRGCLMNAIAGKVAGASALPLPRQPSEQLCTVCTPKGPLPEGYRRLVKPDMRFKDPEP